MHLHHLHLPKPIFYSRSLRLQEALLERHFAHKDALRAATKDASIKPHPIEPPPPTLLTFQTHPTYTVGRRHLKDNLLSQAQIAFLTRNADNIRTTENAPEEAQLPSEHQLGATSKNIEGLGSIGWDAERKSPAQMDLAAFHSSPRGGLLTYHAPGQLTAYLVLDLRKHGLTPRCYVRMLESVVMRTCAKLGVGNVMTTEDPGVWIAENGSVEEDQIDTQQRDSQETDIATGAGVSTTSSSEVETSSLALRPTNRKICAVGVHITRGITSHGIGLNVHDAPIRTHKQPKELYTLPKDNIYTQQEGTDIRRNKSDSAEEPPEDSLIPAPGFLSWGFSRIIACGLEGKSVTWLSREQPPSYHTPTMEAVAMALAREVAVSLKIEENNVVSVAEEDVLDQYKRKDWQFLRGRSAEVGKKKEKDLRTWYAIKDTRKDGGLRLG